MAGVDDLYELPLDEFTSARNALAKELARGGDKAAAEEVKRLTKPSKTAWALNQLARQQPGEVTKLLEAGERLRDAQQHALAGDASRLRDATRAEQGQVDALADAAVALIGGGDAMRDRLRRTLRAAATDPATGELLQAGRLFADVEATGFGLEGLADVPFVASPPVPRAAPTAAKPAAKPPAKPAKPTEDETALREAYKEAARLRKDAEAAERRAKRLVDVADRAEERAREARSEANEAVAAAEEAQRRAEDAAGRAERLKVSS